MVFLDLFELSLSLFEFGFEEIKVVCNLLVFRGLFSDIFYGRSLKIKSPKLLKLFFFDPKYLNLSFKVLVTFLQKQILRPDLVVKFTQVVNFLLKLLRLFRFKSLKLS
ncbi:hypothetical protein L596_021843 [Steinernema carpocapsae]|uniref:Uncharacterized protein n=1 Tax=Steinernema carpocapsae TaxID=34508 RepID=A0A4V6A016_STECR|nr:hypothetical protein L596_021843 [Steinernema carpocapsae]